MTPKQPPTLRQKSRRLALADLPQDPPPPRVGEIDYLQALGRAAHVYLALYDEHRAAADGEQPNGSPWPKAEIRRCERDLTAAWHELRNLYDEGAFAGLFCGRTAGGPRVFDQAALLAENIALRAEINAGRGLSADAWNECWELRREVERLRREVGEGTC